MAERPWFAPVWEATSAGGVLEAYAGVCTLIARRGARTFEAVRRAADTSPEAAELWSTARRNRRAGAETVARRADQVGGLRPDLSLAHATDVLWVFNDPAHYAALVLDCGWSEDGYRSWLADQMAAALLPGGAVTISR